MGAKLPREPSVAMVDGGWNGGDGEWDGRDETDGLHSVGVFSNVWGPKGTLD